MLPRPLAIVLLILVSAHGPSAAAQSPTDEAPLRAQLRGYREMTNQARSRFMSRLSQEDRVVLLAALEDSSENALVRILASNLMRDLPDPVSPTDAWLDLMQRDPDVQIRFYCAARLLQSAGEHSEAEQMLLNGLSDPDVETRLRATRELGGWCKSDRVATALVNSIRGSREWTEKREHLRALLSMRSCQLAAKYVHALLDDEDPLTRAQVSIALTRDGVMSDRVVSALNAGLAGSDHDLRSECALVLLGMEEALEREDVLDALVDALRSTDRTVRGNAAGNLSEFGARALTAEGELLRLLDDGDSYVRGAAAFTLGTIECENPRALIPLARNVADEDDEMAGYALAAFASIASRVEAPDAIEQVLCSAEYREGVRSAAATAIGQWSPEAQERAAGRLRELAGSAALSTSARTWLLFALGEIGEAAAGSLPMLRSLAASSQESSIRWEAVRAMDRIISDILGRALETLDGVVVSGAPEPLLTHARDTADRLRSAR